MAQDLYRLFNLAPLDTCDAGNRDLILCARLWVSLRKRGDDPTALMATRLGSEAAAWQFWLLMEEIGTAWPEPFIVSPPCCSAMSFDEHVLAGMVERASRGDRSGFSGLLCEMLPAEHCERLYRTTGAFLDSLAKPAFSR